MIRVKKYTAPTQGRPTTLILADGRILRATNNSGAMCDQGRRVDARGWLQRDIRGRWLFDERPDGCGWTDLKV